VVEGPSRDDAADGGSGPGFDALLGALGHALRSGSWPSGRTGATWSGAWAAAARDVPPDLADHLLSATAQLLGAVRGFVDVAERVVDEQRARLRDDHLEPTAPDDGPDGNGPVDDRPVEDGPVGSDGEPPEDASAARPRSRRVRRIALDDDT
jgi:hypothetical protein